MHNLSDVIVQLRRYNKTEIINIGSTIVTNSFFNKESYRNDHYILIHAYAPKLIMLCLATTNNFAGDTLNNEIFYKLCDYYLNVKDPIIDKKFLDNESELILKHLTTQDKKYKIPLKYLNQEIIKNTCKIIFISRAARQSHETYYISMQEFYMTYNILLRLNEYAKGKFNETFQNIFELNPLHFMRAAFCLFSINKNSNGKILFDTITYEDEVKKKLNIDVDLCKLIASKICCFESKLRKEWLEKKVLSQPTLYQKFYPFPLNTPIIKMDQTNTMDYLIPSPALYLRGIREAIFTQLLNNNISAQIGNAVEDHILIGLQKIFDEGRVAKIPLSEKPSADFCIDLDNCILILECKLSLGAFSNLSIMSPENIADIWSRLYKSCCQCAASVQNFRYQNKPIIPIVIVSSHITAEALPFQFFAANSNLFKDMEIDHLEFFSWDAFQYYLSKSSITKFVEKLIERKNNTNATVGEIMYFDLDRDRPAHNYEYNKREEYEIFSKGF